MSEPQDGQDRRTSEPVVVPRWLQLVLVPLGVLGLWQILKAAGGVLLLFIIAALIALLLNPFVTLLRRARFPRGLAVLTVFLVLIAVVGGIVALLANPIADQVSALQRNVPDYVDEANDALVNFEGWLQDRGIDAHIADEGRTAVQTLGDNLTKGSGDLVGFTR